MNSDSLRILKPLLGILGMWAVYLIEADIDNQQPELDLAN